MIKKFLIILFVFGFLLIIPQGALALDINIPRVITTPIILPTTTPTPTSAPLIKPRAVTTIVLPPTATSSPTSTPTQEVLISPTPQPTPTPQISPLPTPAGPTNIWQLTTIGLAGAIIGGMIVALVLKKR